MADPSHKSTASPHSVLLLPETLALIFRSLANECSSLASCMRVNRIWFKEAQRVLWRKCGSEVGDGPEIHDLAAIALNRDRGQLYAAQIRRLYIGLPEISLRQASNPLDVIDLQFPRLRSLTLCEDRRRLIDQSHQICRHLQRSVKSLKILDGALSPDFFSVIRVRSQSKLLMVSNM